MTSEEISNLYIRIAFQYESALNQLIDKGLVDKDLADKSRNAFYESLDEEKLRTSQKIRRCLKIGNVPNGEGSFRQTKPI